MQWLFCVLHFVIAPCIVFIVKRGVSHSCAEFRSGDSQEMMQLVIHHNCLQFYLTDISLTVIYWETATGNAIHLSLRLASTAIVK